MPILTPWSSTGMGDIRASHIYHKLRNNTWPLEQIRFSDSGNLERRKLLRAFPRRCCRWYDGTSKYSHHLYRILRHHLLRALASRRRLYPNASSLRCNFWLRQREQLELESSLRRPNVQNRALWQILRFVLDVCRFWNIDSSPYCWPGSYCQCGKLWGCHYLCWPILYCCLRLPYRSKSFESWLEDQYGLLKTSSTTSDALLRLP